MSDTPYQKRYTAHQERKRKQITESVGEPVKSWQTLSKPVYAALDRRRSQRIFTNQPLTQKELDTILTAATMSPNSCNRHGLLIKVVTDRRQKELLGGLLVGGVGWVHRAQAILLFLADPVAYASPNEKDFMHYCDVGFKAMSMWLVAESIEVGACYINPNLVDKELFNMRFGGQEMVPVANHIDRKNVAGISMPFIFCGALALGHFDKRPAQADRPSINEITL